MNPHDPQTEHRDWKAERAAIDLAAAGREALIAESFARIIGRPLVAANSSPAETLWALSAVVVAHGTEADPLFFYGNRAALSLFAMAAADFIGMASRLSAEAPDRARRAELMERVTRDNFVRDYSGVRVAANGTRFHIEDAIVWNLIDADGAYRGQAATFDRWTPLD